MCHPISIAESVGKMNTPKACLLPVLALVLSAPPGPTCKSRLPGGRFLRRRLHVSPVGVLGGGYFWFLFTIGQKRRNPSLCTTTHLVLVVI